MITKNISNRRENLHGNRQPNNWDLNDVVSVQPRYHLHWRMIYCTSYYFFDVRIKYIETLIMIITKNMRLYFVFLPQFCSNFSMKYFINKILSTCDAYAPYSFAKLTFNQKTIFFIEMRHREEL